MRKLAIAVIVAAGLVGFHRSAAALTVSGTLYEDSVQLACGPASSCLLTFSVLPPSTTGKLVRIADVSCEFVASQKVTGVRLLLTDQGLNERRPHYLPSPNQSGQFTYRSPVDFTITGGPPRQLWLVINAESTSNILNGSCTIVGTISAP